MAPGCSGPPERAREELGRPLQHRRALDLVTAPTTAPVTYRALFGLPGLPRLAGATVVARTGGLADTGIDANLAAIAAVVDPLRPEASDTVFEREPEELCRVEPMHRRPGVETLIDIGRDALLPRNCDKGRDEAVIAIAVGTTPTLIGEPEVWAIVPLEIA